MKKALALVLALVLALSLGVSAFALTLVPVTEDEKDSATLIDISKYQLTDTDADEYGKAVYLAGPDGGTYYVKLDGTNEYKDITVSGTGIVSAKVVKYDTSKMTGIDTNWHIEKNGVKYDLSNDQDVVNEVNKKSFNSDYVSTAKWVDKDGNTQEVKSEDRLKTIIDSIADGYTLKEIYDYWVNNSNNDKSWQVDSKWTAIEAVYTHDTTAQDYNVALAEKLNEKYSTRTFSAASDENIYVIELTVEPNYSAAYKSGTVKVTAKEWDGTTDSKGRKVWTNVSGSITVISDVSIFEYELVNYYGEKEQILSVAAQTGYSDYLVSRTGYDKNKVYDEQTLRYDEATVISTTAFRSLRENGNGIIVDSEDLIVTIPEIGTSQKGVNFAAYGVEFVKANGKTAAKGEAVKAEFGFYGDQTIASDFSIEVNLGVDAFYLREMFGERVEEEDIVTYYVVKDGKVVDSFTVDYMKDEIDEDLVLEIKNKAGSTLGQYEIVLEVPASSDNKGEENPNTGAESVIGVVAAMAVVSVAAAAAVSLKK